MNWSMWARTRGTTWLELSLQVCSSTCRNAFDLVPRGRDKCQLIPSAWFFSLSLSKWKAQLGRGGEDGPGIAKSSLLSLAALWVIDGLLATGPQLLRWMIRSDSHIFHTENDLWQQLPHAKYGLAFCIKKKKIPEAKYTHLKILSWCVYFSGLFRL